MLPSRSRPPVVRALVGLGAAVALATVVLTGPADPSANTVGADDTVPAQQQLPSNAEVGIAEAVGTASKFVPITPTRALDTRTDEGYGKVYRNSAISFDPVTDTGVAEAAGIAPDEIVAVAANITVVQAGGSGYATVWPTGTERPTTATNNSEVAGQNIGNLVLAPLGIERKISFYPSVDAHITVDVLGVFARSGASADGRFVPTGPVRHTDTRDGTPFAADETRTLDLTTAGVPADATGVVMNLTAFDANGRGYYTVWPAGEPRPNTSNVNVNGRGLAAGNQVITTLDDGSIDVFTNIGSQITIDITGYFTGAAGAPVTDGLFVPFSPARFLDTREPGGATGLTGGEALDGGKGFNLPLEGRNEMPDVGVRAVALNLTAVQTSGRGHVKAFAAGTPEPDTSTLNFSIAGQTVPNHAITAVSEGATGAIEVLPSVDTHLVVDATGYFLDDEGVVPTSSVVAKSVDPGSFVPEKLGAPPATTPYDFLFDRSRYLSSGARPSPTINTRFSACAPIRYAVNVDIADNEAITDLIASVEELERATGIDFQYAGATSAGTNLSNELLVPEASRPALPYRFLPPDADVIIGYSNAEYSDAIAGSIVGVGGGLRVPSTERMFRGFALIDIGDLNTSADRRSAAVHEMGHMVGLGHVTDFNPRTGSTSTAFQGLDPRAGTWDGVEVRRQLMYPLLFGDDGRFQPGDRHGLWQLYGTQNCEAGRGSAAPVDEESIDWTGVELAYEY